VEKKCIATEVGDLDAKTNREQLDEVKTYTYLRSAGA
jgi:hypothetical protein